MFWVIKSENDRATFVIAVRNKSTSVIEKITDVDFDIKMRKWLKNFA